MVFGATNTASADMDMARAEFNLPASLEHPASIYLDDWAWRIV